VRSLAKYRSCRTCRHLHKIVDTPWGSISYNTLDKWTGDFARSVYVCLATSNVLDGKAVATFNRQYGMVHDKVDIKPKWMRTVEFQKITNEIHDKLWRWNAKLPQDRRLNKDALDALVESEAQLELRRRNKGKRGKSKIKPYYIGDWFCEYPTRFFTFEELVSKDLADHATGCEIWPGCNERCGRCNQYYCIEPRKIARDTLLLHTIKEGDKVG